MDDATLRRLLKLADHWAFIAGLTLQGLGSLDHPATIRLPDDPKARRAWKCAVDLVHELARIRGCSAAQLLAARVAAAPSSPGLDAGVEATTAGPVVLAGGC